MDDPEASARASLRRSMLIYAALLAADIAVISYIATAGGGSGAAFVTLSIVAIVGLLLGYEVIQHLRDLNEPLAESEGVIDRKWKRADLIIAWQSYYVTVGRTLFRVRQLDWMEVDEGMYVKVVHFPHTLNVVSIHSARRPPPEPPLSV